MRRDPGWQWQDPRWPARVGDDPRGLVNEALVRAVDLRDVLAADSGGGSEASRAVMLVDVLNSLAAALDQPSPGPQQAH
jgi:hypothetical protein